ncbi:hypothetical protein [Sphingorhabdus sp. M41]|uniref:hypothetical protein n=1 Tax=Sphingorhabdus sp. M41 TaxID=1806885 RepID=UPI00078CE5F0|nr:hypothetical protein [Sphingorhabdus sp. M41]AMO71595.1 hypothetical protein AZE99_06765 [Sphingorhabdus sp. M41]
MKKSTKPLAIATAGSILTLAYGASFLMPAPVEANIGFARSSGLSCSECHATPSNPTKQALTLTGRRFKNCVYSPNPGTVDCNTQAVSGSNNAKGTGNNAVYGQPVAAPYPVANPGYQQPVNPGYLQPGNPGYVQTPQGGYPGGTRPVTAPPAPQKKSNGVRDFLLGLLGAPAATTQNPSTPGYRPPTNYVQPRPNYTAPAGGYDPGQRWIIVERLGNGRVLDSTWRRRPGTNYFDAVFMDSLNGSQSNDVVIYEQFRNGQINFRRQSTGTVYKGNLTPDGRMVLGGTTNKNAAYLTWTGTQFDR